MFLLALLLETLSSAQPASAEGTILPLADGPALEWSTFLGSASHDLARDIATDDAGNVYVVGYGAEEWGTPIRAHSGDHDAFVTKLDRNGGLVWNTFLGGSATDSGWAVDVDDEGFVIVAGQSAGTWGDPIRPFAGGFDAFVAKLDPNGTLLWSTFLGGSTYDTAKGVAADSEQHIYVAGFATASWGTPVRPFTAGQDSYVARLDEHGALQWNTFLGGDSTDSAFAVATGNDGTSFVVGTSASSWGTPIRPFSDVMDGYAAGLGSDGTLSWNTFLGGAGSDALFRCARDVEGDLYVAGHSSSSWGTPVQPYVGGWDAIVARLDVSGDIIWTTYVGGLGTDIAWTIAIDSMSRLVVAGSSDYSWGDPIRPYELGDDGFVAGLSTQGVTTWNGFLGGWGVDGSSGAAASEPGMVYIAGSSDRAWGSPLREYTALFDAFVVGLTAPINSQPVQEIPASSPNALAALASAVALAGLLKLRDRERKSSSLEAPRAPN